MYINKPFVKDICLVNFDVQFTNFITTPANFSAIKLLVANMIIKIREEKPNKKLTKTISITII